MELMEAEQAIKALLPSKRYRHSLGVSQTAGKLAAKYGADRDKAELAGMLHDIAKYFPDDALTAMLQRRPDYGTDFLSYSDKLWHAPAGAIYAEEKCGIDDTEILQAILYHTTGRAGMSLLEKIIFLADYIEPGRDFPGVDEVREAAKHDLDEAVFLELQKTTIYLMEKRQRVYPKTFEAYNDLAGRNN
ncbi:bis(5'-nucleosyl)-tetraphosphatase (symmetrical) YqeK [Sporolactobacillus spathodeae]|uniref:bis(5'-nucleosyl)-tetraphosphatase (symmetrical) n=1 Tax=Sporolactobacillus spathodeae TaxID=1465502 RepID=A0ABS2Q6F9_9BACL|nr:bis(5'-nucleosyl)-tetraphosphatase (symmetrical) YqeK [Sporolactobacillus spathodeae]MBM7657367.1 putative HD superfamily hydrolase involved in NAD metabolism [Sporolactobacillus spathodeae]